ncbi:sigma-54-dependent transcriptional regulator [Wukongibacter sp. M2B1]|uniref:sigma-54-dependent transcriptional regulator n=1 Tax=Wukongibacter sp. M2B1 TaxID=3088895 RepID=UPI003D79BD14
MSKVFIVDDHKEITDLLQRVLRKENIEADTFYDAYSVIEALKKVLPEVILLDVQMPNIDGIEIMKIVRKRYPEVKIIIMTAYAERYKSEFFLQNGAIDFISKPFKLKDIRKVIFRVLDRDNFSHNNLEAESVRIVGESSKLKDCMDRALKLSNSDAPILISGESGTGKELIVDFIHYNSIRKHNKLIKINCAAIPGELLESELFGYEKGAFTGAVTFKRGKLEEASEGTLFLDEISELDEKLQTKLLRVLEYKTFERLGSNKQVFSDFRLLCASNKEIAQEVNKGNFREDLFYRINTFNIYVPSLRERKEDIPILINYFIEQFRKDYVTRVKKLNGDAIEILTRHNWPGNIRELKNVIQRIISISNNEEITKEDISFYLSLNDKKNEDSRYVHNQDMLSLEELEKQHILYVLTEVKGNKDKAVDILGISKKTLYNKIRKYNI